MKCNTINLKYGYLIKKYTNVLNIDFNKYIIDKYTHELSQNFIVDIDKFIVGDKEQFITDLLTYINDYNIKTIRIEMSDCCFKSLDEPCDKNNLIYSSELSRIKKDSILLRKEYGFVVGNNKLFKPYTLFIVLNFKALEDRNLKGSSISLSKTGIMNAIRDNNYDDIIKSIKEGNINEK